MAEGGALLRRYMGLNPYRGFESLLLRQLKKTLRGSFLIGEVRGLIQTLRFAEALVPGKGQRLGFLSLPFRDSPSSGTLNSSLKQAGLKK